MISAITNKNTLGNYEILRPSRFNTLLEIWSRPIDNLSNLFYHDSISGILKAQYGGLFVSIFERLLRIDWMTSKSKHELVNHLMHNAGLFGSFPYFLKILSLIFETNNITITPSLGDLSIIVRGGSSQLLANILTWEEGKLQIDSLDLREHMAQVESPVFGGDDVGGFLRAFLSNFLVCGDFASITLEAIEYGR